MLKNYISQSQLSIRTYTGRRILFEDMSKGGSFFSTSNIEIQEELEQHPLFGRDFDWDSATKRNVLNPVVEEIETETKVENEFNAEEEISDVDCVIESEVKDVDVSGVADAKDYLADNFGVMRTQMRTKAQIKEIAEQYHINFVGL